jgi:branched-chain amino acid transport system permease protein
LFGRIDINSPTAIYYLVLAVLAICLFGLRGIRESRTGRALIAMRDNERGAQAFGLNATRTRLVAFALSGALASLAGCLFVHHQQAIGIQPYEPFENLIVFTMVIIGGVTVPIGAVLGALYLQGTQWFLPTEWQGIASGVGVLAILLVLPGGLGGLLYRLRDRWLARVATSHAIDAPGLATAAPTADDIDPSEIPLAEEPAMVPP